MPVSSFDDIATEFQARVARIVWCTVATVDRAGRPRTRILHPIWEGTTGWIMTGRQTLKTKHLAANPELALTYWDAAQQEIHAQCVAEWADDPAEKLRIWNLFKATPPPLGYDGAMFFGSPDSPGYGLLKLTPRWIELRGLADFGQGLGARRWVNPEAPA